LLIAGLAISGALACEKASLLGPIVAGDIADQRAAWTAKGIDDYVFTVTHATAWVSPMKSVVSVTGGEVVGCRDYETNLAVDISDSWRCPTVDLLFDRAESLMASGDGRVVTLGFDEQLGLIRTMYADVPGWADEEYNYAVHYFRRK